MDIRISLQCNVAQVAVGGYLSNAAGNSTTRWHFQDNNSKKYSGACATYPKTAIPF